MNKPNDVTGGSGTTFCSVVSFGGGVNSTAMLIGMILRGERPNAILFADTGGEKPATYDFVAMFRDWLVKHDLKLTVIAYSAKRLVLVDALRSGNDTQWTRDRIETVM